jgi:SAM-dependent MidA family methyltransferase
MTTIYDNPQHHPQPRSDALARSIALSDYIREILSKQNSALSFAEFMELALYHAEWGYYNANTFDIGKHGDFTTAPEISPLFAQCLARQQQEIAEILGKNNILELGAGTGRLAGELLSACEKLGCLPQHYLIYEPSQGLREKQQAFLARTYPDFFPLLEWVDTLPNDFIGTIIANEVLDALPVHCLLIDDNHQIKERCVAWDGEKFAWQPCPPTSTELEKKAEELRDLYGLQPGYEFEINLYAPAFIESLSYSLAKGIVLFSDYGYGQREYYHPQRRQGTLTCFYQHSKNNNPLIMPGLQDITSHVDFTSIIDKGIDCGFKLAGYTSQAGFLLACGLTTLVQAAEKNLCAADTLALHHAVKILTLPSEMGERVKFMALSKGLDFDLLGFKLQDKRREL